MADYADISSDYQEHNLQEALYKVFQNARQYRKTHVACLNCGEPITVGSFCERECRDDFQRRETVAQHHTDLETVE